MLTTAKVNEAETVKGFESTEKATLGRVSDVSKRKSVLFSSFRNH